MIHFAKITTNIGHHEFAQFDSPKGDEATEKAEAIADQIARQRGEEITRIEVYEATLVESFNL